jgi:hypothetical protein
VASSRQPLFRQTANLPPGPGALQDAVVDWVRRQGSARATPFGAPTTVKHAEYSARLGDLVLCDASGGAFTVWLPKVTARDAGAVVSVKDAVGSAGIITVRPGDSSALIGAAASVDLSLWAGSSFVVLSSTVWGQM